MLFLKRIEAFGFKSFADETIIPFEQEMIGIVGPNGSGKSNINDAIRWCLGEQSLKSLRGNNSDDVIFNGTDIKKPLNVAEIKLVFDNSSRFFDMDFNEIEICRRMYRGSGESEYFINKERVRMKDVQDLALASGLTKSSLAIISQGNINSFAEAKPIERRILFEEASGTAKYKKQKLESLRKLERTNENLVRLQDILSEIERKLPSLKRQSEKAKKYKNCKEKLNKIEVAVLVKDLIIFNKKLTDLKQNYESFYLEKNALQRKITNKQNEFEVANKSNYEIDEKINDLNRKYQTLINHIGTLKINKMELVNKEKNKNQSQYDANIASLLLNYNEKKHKLIAEENKLIALEQNQVENKKTNIALETEYNKINNQITTINQEMIRYESKIEQINKYYEQLDNLHEGVRNIIKNKNILSGIEGLVQDLVKVEEKYELAISIALAGRNQDIVVATVEDAKKAINYLKNNYAGRANFIPLDIISARPINENDKFVAAKVKGYLGIANELVKVIKQDYNKAITYLLCRYIICDTFDSAQEVAKILNYRYSVLTLEGEVIRPQGAVAGGSQKKQNVNQKQEKEIIDLTTELEKLVEYQQKISKRANQLKNDIVVNLERINELQITLGTGKKQVVILNEELEKIISEYQVLTGKNIADNKTLEINELDTLSQKITEAELKKSEIEQELNINHNLKEKQIQIINTINSELNEQRVFLANLTEKINEINSQIMLSNNQIDQDLVRLSEEYQMTFEHAKTLDLQVDENDEKNVRNEIKELRSELTSIGNVNLEAIEEFEQEFERFTFINNEVKELTESTNNILSSIDEIDNLMKEQFTKTIDLVNMHLDDTFKVLFGGGTAKIIYTDPENILETGIDIKVYPPGKKITNLNLLSGGEKSLVVLSVLFAILKSKPIPLVILDEAEAPLDPNNVERFAKYIRSFLFTTQFVIITHRIGTMEHCDILYGVTMQEKGITKIVGIKLQQAKEIIDTSQKKEQINA